eukprot:5206933-Prymnesium_polylepis.3
MEGRAKGRAVRRLCARPDGCACARRAHAPPCRISAAPRRNHHAHSSLLHSRHAMGARTLSSSAEAASLRKTSVRPSKYDDGSTPTSSSNAF